MGRQSKILLNPFKGTVLIGEGTSLSTSPCFRVLWRQGGDGDDGSQTAGRGWITVVLRKASQIFRLANDLSNLYPMDRKGMRLLDAMLLAMPRT